jgi:hypothetical protein
MGTVINRQSLRTIISSSNTSWYGFSDKSCLVDFVNPPARRDAGTLQAADGLIRLFLPGYCEFTSIYFWGYSETTGKGSFKGKGSEYSDEGVIKPA